MKPKPPQNLWEAIDEAYAKTAAVPENVVSVPAIMERYKMKRSTARALIDRMVAAGTLEDAGFMGPKNTHYYRMKNEN